jgi:lauroyl/myristoyl acyltransferase
MQLFSNQRSLVFACARAPKIIRSLLINLVAFAFFLLDIDNCRSLIWAPIRQAFPKNSFWYCLAVAIKATQTSLFYCVTTIDLALRPLTQIEKSYKQRLTISGLCELESALLHKRGVVLASSHFSCFYVALFADAVNQERLTMAVAQPPLGQLETSFFHKLQALARNHALEHIDLAKARAGLDFLGAVRSGKIVACMIDNVNQGTAAVYVEFLGQQTAFPAGLFAIASKCDAPILPVHVEYLPSEDVFQVTFGKMILTDSSAPMEKRVQTSAQTVASYFSAVITERPGSWESWRTLSYRRLD